MRLDALALFVLHLLEETNIKLSQNSSDVWLRRLDKSGGSRCPRIRPHLDLRPAGRGRTAYSIETTSSGILGHPKARLIRMRLLLGSMICVWIALVMGSAAKAEPVEDEWFGNLLLPSVERHDDQFFSTCEGNCQISLYGGPLVTNDATQIFLTAPSLPTRWHYGDAGIVAGSFSRRLLTLWGGLDIEPQIGVARRFGDMRANELWVAMMFRWTKFPWSDYVRTTVGLADGLNYATAIDEVERRQSKAGYGSHLLNMASPELTLGLPSEPNWDLIFVFHHRSGVFGLINHVGAASQFGTVGLSLRF